MALFDFDGGPSNIFQSGPTATLAVFDNGVNFTLSTTANPGSSQISYSPTTNGQLSISDFSGQGTFTFDVAGTEPNQFFAGNGLQMAIDDFSFSGTWNVTFVSAAGDNATNNLTFTVTSPTQDINLGATTKVFSEIRFTAAGTNNYITVDSLDATLLCFLEGTVIATPEGGKRVEDLRAGDTVLTADGGTTCVQWLGEQPVDTRLSNPAKVNPIRIRAGALAEGVPARDLLVSPDHAIGIGDYLVNASALVNGTTITREGRMPGASFTYYHVETGAHELLLAEGCAAESYVDFITREGFVNGAERADAPAIPEMAAPRISAARHLPQDIRAALAERAGAPGLTARAA